MLVSTLRKLRGRLSSVTLAKGQAYQRERRVVWVHLNEDGINAVVRGSRKRPYEIAIPVVARGNYVGRCSCPLVFDCKHVAAVLDEVIEGLTQDPPLFTEAEQAAALRATAPPANASEKPADAASAIIAWVHHVSQVAKADQHSDGQLQLSQRLQQLQYVCDLRDVRSVRRLIVEPYLVSIAKSGVPGNRRLLPFIKIASSDASYVAPVDTAIARLAGAAGLNESLYEESARALGALWEQLVESGRCFWKANAVRPLAQGEDVAGKPEWRLGEDGRQRLVGVTTDERELLVLPTDPPRYVDTSAYRSGKIDLGVPDEIGAALAHAPALTLEQVRRTRELWKNTPALADVAAPNPDAIVNVVDDPPTPIATLRTHGTTHTLEIVFDYAGKIIDAPNRLSEFSSHQENGVVVRKRRIDIERSVFDRATSYSFELIDPADGVHTRGPEFPPLRFAQNEQWRWAKFLNVDMPQLEKEGWRFEIDESFQFEVTRADAEWQSDIIETENAWFTFDLGVEINGERVPLLPIIVDAFQRYDLAGTRLDGATLDAMIENGESVYAQRADGAVIALPPERLRLVLATLVELFDQNALSDDGLLPLPKVSIAAIDQIERAFNARWRGGERLRAFVRALRPADQLPVQKMPAAFRATLRPYQEAGVAWLQFMRTHGFGGILADDMGLGKTVQLLAHLSIEKAERRLRRPALIVAPTSVVPNWCAEIERFAPHLRVVVLTGADRAERIADIAGADIVITNYALLVRDAVQLLDITWQFAVLDEAQSIKNPSSKGAKIATQLRAEQRIALTGTPVENHLDELWSLMSFAVPGLLGERTRFTRLFRTPIEKQSNRDRRTALAHRVQPFVLRRTKQSVALDLPEKTEIVQRIELHGKQRDLYETIRLAMHKRVRDEITKRGLARSGIVVLDALLKLRQACCDPRLVKSPAARSVTGSAKLELLMEVLPELLEDGRKVLLFSQFTSMLDLIKPELRAHDIPFVELRGDTKDRVTPVKRFQAGEVPLFLISLKAGGTGLNLTAADTVIHYDPWWNPAVERQATDRAHRIGQTQPVFVYKYVAVGTVEEQILDLQQRKGELAASLFEEVSQSNAALKETDVDWLFAPLDALE